MAAFDRVPRPIRAFIANSELPPIITELSAKYGLHVDSSGILADIVTKTLLGFIRPDVLPGTLSAQLHLAEQATNALLADINERVFMPLQKRVREAAEEEERERALEADLAASAPPDPIAESEPAAVPAKPEPLPPPALEYEPARPAEQPVPTLPGSPVPAPMLQPAETPVPAQQHVVHAAPPIQGQGWHPAAAVHIFVPSHGTPAAPVAAPVLEAPQQAIAVAAPAPAAPSYAPPIQQPSAPIAPPAPQNPESSAPRYAADPYREPI